MLGITSCKVKKGEKTGNIYIGRWINVADKSKNGYFRFKIVSDDYLVKKDFNNLSGVDGQMAISTKSMLAFENEDIVMFQGQRYNIVRIDGNRKDDMDSELAFANFKNNGNLTTTLILRRAGA